MRFRPTTFRLAVLLAWLLLPATSHAAEEWILTTAEFRTERVTLRGISDAGIIINSSQGQGRQIPFDQMLQLERIAPPQAAATGFMLHMADGERLAGAPESLEGETLVWKTPLLGDIRVQLSDVRAIVQPKHTNASSASGRRNTEDVITLVNGDTVRGIIAAITAQAITIQAVGTDPVEVSLGSIGSVEFAVIGDGGNKSPAATTRAFRVSLTDSTVITAPQIELQGQKLSLELADEPMRAVPLASVSAIEQINGPVVWLSLRQPSENIHTPFLEYDAPAQMNQSVTGGPIRFGSRTYSRGIGVHSYSRLSWPIERQYRAFRTQYAIDGQLPYADVTVRIRLDDRIVHEQKNFRAGVLSPVILLDTAGASTITLEVDMGETYDVQDRFNWIEPALLKQKPAPPAPPPAAPTAPLAAPTTTPATAPATAPH